MRCVYGLVSILCSSCIALIAGVVSFADIRIRSRGRALLVCAGDDFGTAFRTIRTGTSVVVSYTTLFSLCDLNRNRDSFFTHILSLLSLL